EFALNEIQKKHMIRGLSHIYETSPVGYVKQAAFWNLVVAIETAEFPKTIRKWLGAIESKAGRRRSSNPNAPRTLDIDLLLWGDLLEKSGKSSLPHPDIAEKAFVLFPLLEINPNLVHPALGRPLIELAAKFKDRSQKIRQLPGNTFLNFRPVNLP
ncbi:MAG TPA: 2-amino-4-hydroxy-6-hydroxymethyldihydropteridine diphosphokinase, partial [bacterium]|nr:2-amino-4-hydroxy-6-hydroxymethyldihydropteridine diphosphokinase [bacterium]